MTTSIAVIARSTSHLESLRRALTASGVPVTMASADIPLPDEPAVATLRSGGALRDVAPTLLQLLGLPQPADMSGRSLIDA